MIGGADLDPRLDGFMLHPTVRPMDRRRECFDRKLMQLIVDRKMPIFGIGVGMQLLNITLGGNLFFTPAGRCSCRNPSPRSARSWTSHGLEVATDSLMERVYGEGEIRVSSRHHMAIDEVALGFRVTARCPDGVIEAIESDQDDWVAIGTQFHPENDAASALDMRIFEEFLDLVREPAPMLRAIA